MVTFLASYRHASPFDSSIQLAQGIMCTAIAKLTHDNAFKEREDLNTLIVAAGLKVAEQYVFAFGNLAKEGTSTVFLPNDASSVLSMISRAITLYKRLGGNPSLDKKLLHDFSSNNSVQKVGWESFL